MRLLLPIIIISGLIAVGITLWNKTEKAGVSGQNTVIAGNVELGGDYALTDKTGAQRQSQEFEGRYQLIFFGFTHCPDICPADLAKLTALMNQLGGQSKHVVPVFISLDPERDTPAVLNDYMQSFHPSIVALTGSTDNVNKALKKFKVYASKAPLEDGSYSMDHSAFTYLMDREGNYATHFDHEATVQDMLRELNRRIADDLVAGVTLNAPKEASKAPANDAQKTAPLTSGITFTNPWVRAASGAMSAGYMTINNGTDSTIYITGGNATAVGTIEIHNTTKDEQGVMRMRPVPKLTIEPGNTATLAPSGMHLMLMSLEQPLTAGNTLPIIMHIDGQDSILVNAEVR